MSEKILFVDDERNVLEAYQRALRKLFAIDTAEGGEQALERLEREGPYAVIVSDMRMPGMNGIELLAAVKEAAPHTVRMMLTGNADQETAIEAINKGDIFRFLTKPCPPKELARALLACLNQYRLITAEKELLERTLSGSVHVLTEVLSLVNPEAFGRTNRIRRHMRALASELGVSEPWQMETLASLCQIGTIVVPPEVIARDAAGKHLSEHDARLLARHPRMGAELLAKIPRLEAIAEAIRHQDKHFDGGGSPADGVRGEDIPLGSRLLKVVLDYDRLEASGLTAAQALARMRQQGSRYDPEALAAFERAIARAPARSSRSVSVLHLDDRMVLAEDVVTDKGVLIVAKGQETTASVRERLVSFWRNGRIGEYVQVSVPRSARRAAVAADAAAG